MTCVACSSAIENGMKNEFKDKGLVCDENGTFQVSVVLLMHKMKISFYKSVAELNGIDHKRIADEVEDLGFGATLLNTFEEENENDVSECDLESSREIKSK